MKAIIKRHGILALIALLCVLVARDLVREFRIWAGSPDDWMIVHAVQIPDHVAGDDPMIVYDRTVLRSFRAEWVVEVKSVNGGALVPVCSGSGTNEYDVLEKLGEVRLYDWYMRRRPCVLDLGRYVAKTVWRTGEGIVIRNTSNVFEVHAPESGH